MDQSALEEFKNIYRNVYKEDIDDLEASKYAEALVCLCKEIYLKVDSSHEER